MKYIKFIFESEDVKNLTLKNEDTIKQIVTEHMDSFVNINFEYIIENISKFIDASDVNRTRYNIKEFIKQDMLNLISSISEVAAMDQSFDHINSVMYENVSNVFTGLGYGTQKSARLISSSYTSS